MISLFYINGEESTPPDIPEPRGNGISTDNFADANHAAEKVTRRSQTGILLFYNKILVICHSKIQNSVEVSTFGSEFIAIKNAVELINALK